MRSMTRFSLRHLAALLPAAALGVLLTFSVLEAADPPGFDRAADAKASHVADLMSRDGVVGAGIGLTAQGDAAVVVLTERPGVGGLPRAINGVPVRIMVTGKIHAIHHRDGHAGGPGGDGGTGGGVDPKTAFERPVPIGVSTGNAGSCSAGTIGARVVDAVGSVYALSNNHVYALENDADPLSNGLDSDDTDDVDLTTIIQPGSFDTACDPTVQTPIGTLVDFLPIDFACSFCNTADAAIALSSVGELGNATPTGAGYGIPASAEVSPALGMAVQKYGRTTGLTTGTIAVIDTTVRVSYSSGVAEFSDQIMVDGDKGGFLNSGDSGSLLVTNDGFNSPVGLLFASGRGGKLAFANDIANVLSELGVMIDGQ